jgi:hypothetical protein
MRIFGPKGSFESTFIFHIPGYVRLSPFDYASAGRPVPRVWRYPERLDLAAMVATLEKTLEKYQLFTGRR